MLNSLNWLLYTDLKEKCEINTLQTYCSLVENKHIYLSSDICSKTDQCHTDIK